VLHGEQLEALGVRTVLDALSLVPGIQVSRISSGEPTVKVRGMSFPFNAGNIKVMLNSIAISRESSGINSSVLLTPVALVERIEVIRGPGSAIYGDFAMAGVVNIITRNAGGRVFAGGGDDHSRAAGGHYVYRAPESDLSLGINLSAVDDGESSAINLKDPDEARYLAVATLQYKKFTLTAEGFTRSVEVSPGPAPPGPPGGGPPPPPPPPGGPGPVRTEQLEKVWALQGRQELSLGGADVDLSLGYLKNYSDTDEPSREFRGDRVSAGLDAKFSPWSGQQFLLGMNYAHSVIDHAADIASLNAPGGTGIFSGITRNSYSLGLQDAISLGNRFTLTLGLRYDDYDDVGEHLTPRIAGVFQAAEHHVLKAQYSEGFRAPTFWELYRTGSANENLDFEVIKTLEFSYIYRRPRQVARLTLYHSKIDNGLLSAGAGLPFTNGVDISTQGVELEWEQQLSNTFRWQANLSYVDTRDTRWNQPAGEEESPGIAAWLGNLAGIWQPLPKLTATGRLLYVGERHAAGGSVAGYEIVDFTLSRTDLFRPGLSLRCGVKNIFDHALVYTTQRPIGLSRDEYPGRTWWLQATYDF
jgi:iron complex outermembrane receptor protein